MADLDNVDDFDFEQYFIAEKAEQADLLNSPPGSAEWAYYIPDIGEQFGGVDVAAYDADPILSVVPDATQDILQSIDPLLYDLAASDQYNPQVSQTLATQAQSQAYVYPDPEASSSGIDPYPSYRSPERIAQQQPHHQSNQPLAHNLPFVDTHPYPHLDNARPGQVPRMQKPVPSGPYFNAVLNSFTNNPAAALRVIDQCSPDLGAVIIAALEAELRSQEAQSQGRDQLYRQGQLAEPKKRLPQEDRSVCSPDPADHSLSLPERIVQQNIGGRRLPYIKHGKNRRPGNIRALNPLDYYTPLSRAPQPWGPTDSVTGLPLFHYTQHGELSTEISLSPEEMMHFIDHHPLHIDGAGNYLPNNSGLILQIQTVPADAGRRYPDRLSDKCRFGDCPDVNRTIRKGEFRVCFDEQTHLGRAHDPYHSAGYVHLYCMEKFLDFPSICKQFNVQADTRQFLEGRNKMALTRDHYSMADIAKTFFDTSTSWEQFFNADGSIGRPRDWYGNSGNCLCYELTTHHLAQQPRAVQAVRAKRGGNSIDVHKNNLDLCVAHRRPMRIELIRKTITKTKSKGRARNVLEEDSEDDEPSPTKKSRRTTPASSSRKRSRIADDQDSDPDYEPRRPMKKARRSPRLEGRSHGHN